MKSNYLFCIVFLGLCLFFSGCGEDDPCEGVNVPAGFMCVDGAVIEDPDQWCVRNECEFGCDEENDVCLEACGGATCEAGFMLNTETCNCDKIPPTIENLSGIIRNDMTLSSGNISSGFVIYELDGKVLVADGAVLTIQPGTIIKGKEGSGPDASALVIDRGSKIIAEGTPDEPIIFTSVLDEIEPDQTTNSNLTEQDFGLWGGLIILGSAPISAVNGDTQALVEGLSPDSGLGFYGGDNTNDNSGVLRYVSVRHAGAEFDVDNEINGITLAGVGTGTVIDNIEVVANLDDGIECFGGTVNITNVIVYASGDDGIDLDQNYAGTIDNFLVVQGGDADEALEVDGPEGTTYTNGRFTLQNGTLMSTDGTGSGGDFKSLAQGTVSDCAWTGYQQFLKIRASYNEDDCSDLPDALSNTLSGRLAISNNEIVAAMGTDIINVYTTSEVCPVPENTQNVVDNAATIVFGNQIVSETSKGADLSVFDGWSWASINGKL